MSNYEETANASQHLDNRSFNKELGIYENLIYGYDGTNAVSLKVSADGSVHVVGGDSSEATNFQFYGSTSDATYDYVGYQSADGQWYIMRVHKVDGTATYAVGNSGMAAAWAAYDSQSYDEWDANNQALATISESRNATIYGLTSDSTSQIPRIDASTHSLQTITYEHHEIHSGSHYFVAGQETEALNGTIGFTVTTPNTTKWLHMTFVVEGSQDTTIAVYEGVSAISGGSASTPLNSNRNSANTSGATLLKDPTVAGWGTKIYEQRVGANKQAGAAKREDEMILKQNTAYYFLITSNANGNNISYKGSWYEHTDKGA